MTPERVSDALSRTLTVDQRYELTVGGSPSLALAYSAILFPELTTYRDAWFRTDRFSEANVDDWFRQPGQTKASVERVCSHVHVAEDNLFGEHDAPIEVIHALAEVLAFSWKLWAKARYGLDIETFIDPAEDAGGVYDYEVSFESRQAS